MELLKVPACKNCHANTSNGDDALKALAGMGVVRTPQYESVADDVRRAMKLNPFWKKELVAAIKERGTTPTIELAPGLVGHEIPIPDSLFELVAATIRRIATGLIFLHDPEWDSTDHDFEVECRFEHQIDFVNEILTKLGPFPIVKVVGPKGYFIAGLSFARDDPDAGVIFMNFYGGLSFFVFFKRKGTTWEPRGGSGTVQQAGP